MLLRLVIMENHNIECLLYSLNPKKKKKIWVAALSCKCVNVKYHLNGPSEEGYNIYIYITSTPRPKRSLCLKIPKFNLKLMLSLYCSPSNFIK